METMNVSFDELSAMAFEQHSSKPGLQCMTSGQISSVVDLTYAPSTITTQQPTEDLEVAFRRNTCFVRNLEGVDLLKGNRTTHLYTIKLHDMAFASPICLMARATSTKSWLWHQRLFHLNFYTINDLARNDLVTSLPKFKYQKEHLCPSYEQGKSKRASHSPKPIPNSKQRLHLLHMDLCGPMRIASINGKRKVLVIVDDYCRYTWVTLVEAAIKMLIFSRAPLFLWAEAIATACYTRNRSIIHRQFDKHHTSLLMVENQTSAFFMYLGLSVIPRMIVMILGSLVQNVILDFSLEIINMTFDELSAIAFEQSNLKPRLQSMTSGQISSGLDLPYAPSIISTQKPTEGELDLLFEAMYDDHVGGQPSAAPRTTPAVQAPQVLQTPSVTTKIADTALTTTNSSSQATNIPNTS
nr:retrovirus-related Pol polyprotein from transposon TNT 1-94 [Tanacetum cinerariifolium]